MEKEAVVDEKTPAETKKPVKKNQPSTDNAQSKPEKVEKADVKSKPEKVEKADVESKPEKVEKADVESKQAESEEVKVEGKMAEFIDWIETISVIELSKLVKALEQRLGVSAAVPMAAVGGMAGAQGAGNGTAASEEVQTEFSVMLTEIGGQKIQVIKEVRAITGLGLKESKDLVEAAPKAVKEGIPKDEAEKLKEKLEAVGAKVEIK